MFILFSFIYVFHSYLNIIIVNYLPSEHIAVFRTLAATLVAVIFDSIKFRKIKMKMKDFFVLVIIFFVLFMLDF
jgi:hypothetical protein